MDKRIINLIPWHGGKCPVPHKTPVTVMRNDGSIRSGAANTFRWGHTGTWTDIVGWALIEIKVMPPRIDCSLRGWVLVEMDGTSSVWFADEDGIRTDSTPAYGMDKTWDECETEGYTIRRMTVEDFGVDDE